MSRNNMSTTKRKQMHEKRGSTESAADRNWTELIVGVLVTVAGLYLTTQGMKDRSKKHSSGLLRGKRRSEHNGIEVQESITINRPVTELYRYWRNLENLPNVMRHLENVKDLGGGRSRWVAKGPVGTEIEWYAEIVEDVENSRIVWRSVGDTIVPNEGSVSFNRDPLGKGSQVHVDLTYHPPMGVAGALVARMFGEEPGAQVAADLRRYKQYLESAESPSGPTWAAHA